MRRLSFGLCLLASLFLVACPPGDNGGGSTDSGLVIYTDAGGGDADSTGDADETGDTGSDESCPFTNDGVCDEPANCPLGTDEADCQAACEEAGPEKMAFIGAACRHRDMVDQPDPADSHYDNPEPSEPSADDAHLTGWHDAYIPVTSGRRGASGNALRHFRVYVPPNYDPERAHPLMINMPGHRVSHWILPGFTMLQQTAAANDFIVMFAGQEFRYYDDNEFRHFSRWAFWTEWVGSGMSNPPDACRQNSSESNPDYEFLRKLIDWAGDRYTIDKRRVYASGHSRGAATAMMAALEMPEVAGAAVHSGFTECGYLNEVVGEEGGSWEGRNVPLTFFHGVKDPDICINCEPGASCNVGGRSCGNGLHATDAIVERLKSMGWEEGENLQYYRIERATHDWQSHLNEQMWNFLSSQPKPAE